MSLQFIFGNSGAGKSHFLYNYIVQESMAHPELNYLVLVPEQFTMQTQKDLCMTHQRHGIMNIDVLSFVRLSHRVFEETGRGTKRILDDEGKNLILRKIAGQYEDELKVLKGNLKKQGYISEVKSVISEFTQYGIGFEELDTFLESLEPESYLAYKLRDIRKVYEGFEDYLSDKYITKEELLDVLSDAVPESALLKNSVVVLDGFTGFTPVQNRLLGELLKVCRQVIVTVVIDEREDAFTYRHPYQLFAISKQMVTSLAAIAGKCKTAVEEPVCLYEKPVVRFKENPMLGFLEEELFRYSGRKYIVGEDSRKTENASLAISIHATRNPREEAEFVAAKIRCLVREKCCRYRDIAIIASDMNAYADQLEAQCCAYGVPIFMDHKKSILLNAFVEYVRSLLAMEEQNFSYESVFRFLRTDMTGFTREEVDKLENYVIALGLRGYKKWQGAWVRRTSGVGEEELAELNHLRVRFVEMTDGLTGILKKRGKTIRDVTLAVYEFLRREQIQEQIQAMELRFQAEGELALAKEYSQIYRIVIDLFDKFVELLGEERISLRDYCELLDAGLEEAKVGVIPPGLDQVVIGDMERTRLNNLKVLFFVGANDMFLPGNLGQGGLLSERDREKFAGQKLPLSPGIKEKTYIQKFYLYMNLTKPSKQLVISYAKASAEGKALRPAYLVQDLLRMFPEISVTEEENKKLSVRELTWSGGMKELAAGLRNRHLGFSDEWKELYTWYTDEERKREETTDDLVMAEKIKIHRLLDAAFYHKRAEQLSKDTAQELFGDLTRVSVTRLERFASCAYAHFLTYGLHLSERERYQFEPMDLGNIAHQSMERFARKADERQLDWTEMSDEAQSGLIEESVEESIVDYGNTVLYSTARNEYMITRIKRLIRRSVWALTKQMEKGDFRPSGYELKFGSGKIDRIDTCEDDGTVYVKVTDYKTGTKAFDITAFYYGLQMQLPVYLNAAMELEQKKHHGENIVPAGIFYYRMKDPIVEKEKNDTVLEEKLLRELKLDGLVNAKEAVLQHLERDLRGFSYLNPIGRNNDGSLKANSKVLSEEDFLEFLEYTKQKESELKAEMADGAAGAEPYELGDGTGCDYCAYRDICGFDIRIEGCNYRTLEKYSSEEVMAKIRSALGNEKSGDHAENIDEKGNSSAQDFALAAKSVK
ncbi:PD-(D/E)XK nuclease family protein [Mediterraneibacter agrestimuris]|uniref:PD-(D/E)XK nuclease family protein n=1 Tax=Mediterraneibacter agrestimuris TaxID=2941333 RepID=UPI00203D1A7F|nr:PD-(D/E)XK nuclease family protein [Mediterraneibacter agrestimuris]